MSWEVSLFIPCLKTLVTPADTFIAALSVTHKYICILGEFAISRNLLTLRKAVLPYSARPHMPNHFIQKLENVVNRTKVCRAQSLSRV